MNEEKIAKSVKTLYLITYPIMIVLGIVWIILGAYILKLSNSTDVDISLFGWFFITLGVIFIVMSVCWLVYFIKMPEYSITYKDGKLNFRNKLECTPAQLEYVMAKGGGLDGAVFSFGRIVVSVNGKKYNFRFIQDAQCVANRLIELKKGEVMQNSVFGNAYSSAPETTITETTQPVATENAEAVAEDNGNTEKEDNNG